MQRAVELAPQDARLAWLNLRLCAQTPGCDPRSRATAMRWVDPDNSAAWLGMLAAAHREHDTVEVERVLGDMAQGTRFDLYWNPLVVMMVDALRSVHHRLPKGADASDSERLGTVSGIAEALLIPPFAALSEVCREPAADEEWHANCEKLAHLMQHGDTIVTQLVGFGMERRLLPADGREARVLTERRHLLEWRSAAAGKLDAPPKLPWAKDSHAHLRLAQMRRRLREEDVCIAILRDYKLPLEPAESGR
jgi:hypothetical protein